MVSLLSSYFPFGLLLINYLIVIDLLQLINSPEEKKEYSPLLMVKKVITDIRHLC